MGSTVIVADPIRMTIAQLQPWSKGKTRKRQSHPTELVKLVFESSTLLQAKSALFALFGHRLDDLNGE
jgi:hypothetical protein